MSKASLDFINSGKCYPSEVLNYVLELEQQNNELMEFAKEMREIGKLNPDRLPEYTDIIYHHANDLITRITGGEMSDKRCPLMKRRELFNGEPEDIFLPCIKNDCMAWDEQDNICSMFSSKRIFNVEARVDTRYNL